MSALNNFLASLKGPEELITLLKTYPNPPRPSEVALVNGLKGGIAVLLFACWESYIKELFQEQIDSINKMSINKPWEVPECLRYHNAENLLNSALKKSTGGKGKFTRQKDVELACDRVIRCHIEVSHFTNTKSNPGPDTVNDMFKFVGIEQIFDKVNFEYQVKSNVTVQSTWAYDRLDEMMTRRHLAAHTNQALPIGAGHLEVSLKYLKDSGPIYEKILSTHIIDVIRRAV